MDTDAGRDFKGLDPREAQSALEEELSSENEKNAVSDETENEENKQPSIEWSEEDIAEHVRMAEALLFAAAEPLDEKSIADRLPEGADIKTIIERIEADYEGRGVQLQKIDKVWRFVTAADVAHILDKEKVDAAQAVARRDGDAGDHRLSPALHTGRTLKTCAGFRLRKARSTSFWRLAGCALPASAGMSRGVRHCIERRKTFLSFIRSSPFRTCRDWRT